MSAIACTYIGLCFGFCLGVVVMAFFKGTPISDGRETETPTGGYQPNPSGNARINPPPRRP